MMMKIKIIDKIPRLLQRAVQKMNWIMFAGFKALIFIFFFLEDKSLV